MCYSKFFYLTCFYNLRNSTRCYKTSMSDVIFLIPEVDYPVILDSGMTSH